jgi:DNA-binding response OmpR family regulator
MAIDLLLENSHPTINLTKKEHALLKALYENTCDRKSLMVDVWKFSESYAEKATYKDTRAVDMAVSRLKKKLAPLNIHVLSVRGVGYMLTGLN